MSVIVDYQDLIGVQFAYGGRGPDTYDCYGLAIELYRRLGKDIPDVRSPTELDAIAHQVDLERHKWIEIAKKPESDVIPFSALQPGRLIVLRVKGLACHVGFIHRPRKFLHTWEASNQVIQCELADWRSRITDVYEYGG
jgi:cell wall-associated NlpC family hydrolase